MAYLTANPFNDNENFATKLDKHPRVARLAQFTFGEQRLDSHALRVPMAGKIIVYDRIGNNGITLAAKAAIFLVEEVMRLGWPSVWIVRVLRNIPRRH